MIRKLMATSAASVMGMAVLAMPASAQGQIRGESRGAPQANENIRGGGDTRGSVNMRGSTDVRGAADVRTPRADRGQRPTSQTRTNVRSNVQEHARTRNDVRVRANVNTNMREGIRTDRRQAWSSQRNWRSDQWRYRDRGTRVRVGVGYSEPYAYGGYDNGYYAYGGYDDGYYAYRGYEDGPYAYGSSEPYVRQGYSDSYYSYAASPRCTCSPAPYAAWNNDRRWDGGRWGFGAGAW
jgi:hypothetical protein